MRLDTLSETMLHMRPRVSLMNHWACVKGYSALYFIMDVVRVHKRNDDSQTFHHCPAEGAVVLRCHGTSKYPVNKKEAGALDPSHPTWLRGGCGGHTWRSRAGRRPEALEVAVGYVADGGKSEEGGAEGDPRNSGLHGMDEGIDLRYRR